MGWIHKAAKLTPKAIAKLGHFQSQLAHSGFLSGNAAKIADKSMKLALRTRKSLGEALTSNHGEVVDLIRRESGRNPSVGYQAFGHDVKIAEQHLAHLKKIAPKAYQRIKDFVQSAPAGTNTRRVSKTVQAMRDAHYDRRGIAYTEKAISRAASKTKNLRSLKASAIRAVRSVGTDYDPRKLLESAQILSRRNLLPAAAAGAGVAASRKPKPQGYKYGGMVKRSRKGC